MLSQLVYRVRQFVRGFTAQITLTDEQVLGEVLSGEQRQLFERMPVDAQRHSLNVLHDLRNACHNDADLAVAALLHDVGKVAARDAGAYLGLWLRGPMVILEKIAPWSLTKIASPQPSRSWRYAVHVQNEHPQIGARWAKDAGCSELSCWLIACHQQKQMDGEDSERVTLLKLLQWADNRN